VAKSERERVECNPFMESFPQQQRLASTYKLIGSIYEELECHWEASLFYDVRDDLLLVLVLLNNRKRTPTTLTHYINTYV